MSVVRCAVKPEKVKDERKKTGRKGKPIICINTGDLYSSITEAAKDLKIYAGNITTVCQGKMRQTKGYAFRYATDKESILVRSKD